MKIFNCTILEIMAPSKLAVYIFIILYYKHEATHIYSYIHTKIDMDTFVTVTKVRHPICTLLFFVVFTMAFSLLRPFLYIPKMYFHPLFFLSFFHVSPSQVIYTTRNNRGKTNIPLPSGQVNEHTDVEAFRG